MGKRFKFEFTSMHIIDERTGRMYNCYNSEEMCYLLNEQDEEIKRYQNGLAGFIRNCGTANCKLKNNKAIECLEKIKDYCEENCDEVTDGELSESDWKAKIIGLDRNLCVSDTPLYEFIDNQIAELRGKENG